MYSCKLFVVFRHFCSSISVCHTCLSMFVFMSLLIKSTWYVTCFFSLHIGTWCFLPLCMNLPAQYCTSLFSFMSPWWCSDITTVLFVCIGVVIVTVFSAFMSFSISCYNACLYRKQVLTKIAYGFKNDQQCFWCSASNGSPFRFRY